MKAFTENEVKDCTVSILDNQECATVIRNVNSQLKNVGDINFMINDKITSKHLGVKNVLAKYHRMYCML